jgi:hypothetical protein
VLQRGAAVKVVCYVFGGMSAELPGEGWTLPSLQMF